MSPHHDRVVLRQPRMSPPRSGDAPGDRGDRAARHEQSALGLEDRERHVVEANLRPATRRIVDRDPLRRNAHLAKRRQRRGLEAILATGEPHDARLHEALLADLFAEGDPFRPCLARPAHVEPVEPVRGARDPCLVTGRCPRVARSERIDERDAPAAADGLQRRPGAHRPRADDDEIGHGWRTSVWAAASSMAAVERERHRLAAPPRADHVVVVPQRNGLPLCPVVMIIRAPSRSPMSMAKRMLGRLVTSNTRSGPTGR